MSANTSAKAPAHKGDSSHPYRAITPKPSPRGRSALRRAKPAKRILVVDDDPAVRGALCEVLLTEGYLIVPAEDGQQALELANRTPVDLVLLDLNMPVKNGLDTFERLTTEFPLVPVIIVTARPSQLFLAVNTGAGALLEKPMDIPSLLRAIKALLAESDDDRLARLIGRVPHFHYSTART